MRVARLAIILALLATPLSARAQQARNIPRIGYLCIVTCMDEATLQTPSLEYARLLLVEALGEVGYVDGKNVEIVYRTSPQSGGEPLRLVARDLARLPVNVIFVAGDTVAAQAVKEATPEIPIVIAVSGDPVALGLVKSLARPGGNVTGVTYLREELAAKGLELLKGTVPSVTRVAVLRDPTDPVHTRTLSALEVTARSLGVDLRPIDVPAPTNYEAQFAAMATARIGTLVVFASPTHYQHRSRIAYLAVTRRLAAVSSFREFAAAGGLMAYGPNRRDFMKRAATFVARILQGARPSELPVEQPATFELVINARTAKPLASRSRRQCWPARTRSFSRSCAS
jgi:putative ABC transport system substrate-binding protein